MILALVQKKASIQISLLGIEVNTSLQPIIYQNIRFDQIVSSFSNNFKTTFIMLRKPWTQGEDFALKILVQEIGISNWTFVAVRLAQQCPGSERAGKQCRQRWFNHLDLKISKANWTKSEENIMFQMHNIYGNKWKEIAKHLNARNENDIKNHFYATLRRGLRRLNKILGFKIDPCKVRKIKPSVLSKICENKSKFSDFSKAKQLNCRLFKLILKLSREDSNAIDSEEYIEDQDVIKESQNLLHMLLSQNQIHNESKHKKRLEKKAKQAPARQIKSQAPAEVTMGIDISQYLCFGQKIGEIDLISPKSQGTSSLLSQQSPGTESEQPEFDQKH